MRRLRNLTLRKVGAFKVAMGEGSGRAEPRVRLDAAGDAGWRSIRAVSRARDDACVLADSRLT